MTQKFTPQHLIQYIYKETSASETLAIAEALQNDWELNEHYEELLQGYQQLPKATFSPNGSTLSYISNYSRQTTVEPQH